MSAHNELLQCSLNKIIITTPENIELYLPTLNCTDMSGAIKLCKMISADVNTIHVFVNGIIDIVYYIPSSKSDKWTAKRFNSDK